MSAPFQLIFLVFALVLFIVQAFFSRAGEPAGYRAMFGWLGLACWVFSILVAR